MFVFVGANEKKITTEMILDVAVQALLDAGHLEEGEEVIDE